MIYIKISSGIMIAATMLLSVNRLQARQSKVDAAIVMLNQSNTPKGLDTLTFNKARTFLISTAILTDQQILQLEKAAGQFIKGNDEDLSYAVKFSILETLLLSDKFKAIEYGKLNVQKLDNSKTPRAKYLAQAFLGELRLPYRNSNRLREGFQFFTEKLNDYKKNNDSIGLTTCYWVLGGFYRQIGLYESAMYNMKKSASFIDSSDFTAQQYLDFSVMIGNAGWINNGFIIADYYIQMGQYESAIKQSELTLKIAFNYYKAGGNGFNGAGFGLLFGVRHLALAKIYLNQLDSVDYYLKIADSSSLDISSKPVLMQFRSLYDIKRGAYAEADSILKRCEKMVAIDKIPVAPPSGFVEPDYYLALLSIAQKKYPIAIRYLIRNIDRVKPVRQFVLRDYKLLGSLYEITRDNLKAKEAYKSFINLQDSIAADQSKYRTLSFETEQQISANEFAISKLENENKLSAVTKKFTMGIAALFIMLAGTIYYRFKTKQKANQVLREQKERLEYTLIDLKSTQSQLIQSEKMASLGELTAGVAHEIQNPLNFVNNFSEVNKDLLLELQEDIEKGNYEDAKDIISDVVTNEEKINHHGKRAGDIVKSMLQHSRKSSGHKEPADINKLADEYLRLSYHGLGAKDKSFNAIMITNYDEQIGSINIIGQDIARVLLNLFNNAFYAVNQKKQQGIEGYEPTVTVTTKKTVNQITLQVMDNGNGIPQNIIDKIFQPFFTTKPNGEGTGLGLSLTYDMLVKGHGGSIIVDSKEDAYTIFTITLPLT